MARTGARAATTVALGSHDPRAVDPRLGSPSFEGDRMTRRRVQHLLRTSHLAVAARSRSVRGAVQDAGMATAEYAIGTLAACGFAALLVAILKGGQVKALLLGVITKALSLGG